MKIDNKQIVQSDESQTTEQMVDKSRRSFAKAGVIAPVIMTLNSKVALGTGNGGVPYHCTVSGKLSGNHSSHPDWSEPCPTGCKAKDWKDYCDKDSSPNGGHIGDWRSAGVCPYYIKKTGTKKQYKKRTGESYFNDADGRHQRVKGNFGTPDTYPATTCDDIFGDGDPTTFYDVLEGSKDLRYCAVVDYLNVASGKISIPGINDIDIVNIYEVAKSGGSCSTSGGSLVSRQDVAAAFLNDICPAD